MLVQCHLEEAVALEEVERSSLVETQGRKYHVCPQDPGNHMVLVADAGVNEDIGVLFFWAKKFLGREMGKGACFHFACQGKKLEL